MKINKQCWQCEYPDCGHVWIATDPDAAPNQCSKCKRRGWNSTDSANVQNVTKVTKHKLRSRPVNKLTKRPPAVKKLTTAAPASAAPIVERAVQMAQAKTPNKSKQCPTCGGPAFFRMFAEDHWCPKCGKRVE